MKISITHFGNSHNEWLRAMDFYKGELNILKTRLTEIAGRNTDKDMLAKVEHFENQFKVQQENIDILVHDIKVNLSAISKEAAAASAGYIDGDLLTKHNALSTRYAAEEKVINQLRHEFNEFASIWM